MCIFGEFWVSLPLRLLFLWEGSHVSCEISFACFLLAYFDFDFDFVSVAAVVWEG